MAEIAVSTRPNQRKKAAIITPRLQTYANQSLVELTEKLVKCSKEEKGQNLSSRTRDIVYVLKTHKLRHPCNAHAFDGHHGMESLLALFSLCADQEGRDRGLLLATLANLCSLHKDCRSKVMQLGLTEVASVLTQTHSPATLCTLSRLIANLALDPYNIPQLHEVGVVRELCHALFQSALDCGCRVSILRAVRLLSGSASCREEIKTSEGLLGIMNCLKSLDEAVATSALHTLHVLQQDRDPDVIQSLVANAGLSQVVRLCSHGDQDVARRAVDVLVTCAKSSEGRVGLNSAGGVECLLQQLESRSAGFSDTATALCASCRDVLGRQRMRECGGLLRLIHMLSDPQLASLHGDILSALVCYYFDEHSLKFMVKKLGLLRALTYHLQQMTSRQTGLGERREEDGTEDSEGKEEEEVIGREKSSSNVSSTLSGFETTSSHNLSSSPESGGEEFPRNHSSSPLSWPSPSSSSSLSPKEAARPSPSYPSSPSPETQPLARGSPSLSPEETQPLARGSPSLSPEETQPLARGSPSLSPEETQPLARSSPSLSPEETQPLARSSPSLSPEETQPLARGSPSLSPEETQPPAKRQRFCSDVDFPQPMPANFLDSLLSSPSPYQTSTRQPEVPIIPNLSPSLESHVVQLLSRVSHLRDCLPHLASRELLLAMLACFLSSPSSLNHHIFKTLSRVFANPHCFQEVIGCLIPSKLYQQLYLTPPPSSPPLPATDEFDLSSPVPTLPSPTYLPLSHRPSPTPPGPLFLSGLGHMCQELLSRLSRVAESPYGQGVLAHLLLAGAESDKQASALATPLLCRLPRVCQRLMLDYNGQTVLIQLLATSTALRTVGADSLLALASTASHLVQHRRPTTAVSEHCTTPDTSAGETCRYHDSDHWPFDYVIALHQNGTGTTQHGSGTKQTICLPAHRAVLMEASEVFNGMLGGHFIESTNSEVFLKDVDVKAFCSVLHHMYGCGWQCSEVTKHHSHDESCDLSCDHNNISDSTMAAVTSNFDLPHERVDVLHTLRCLATASQFLLGSLCGLCECRAVRFLRVTTVVPLFIFSQIHGSCWLAERCVQFVVDLSPSLQRRTCLLQLTSCAEGDTAVNMMKTLITAQLQTTHYV